MFGSRPPSRKASTTSIAGGSTGIAAALKAHMGLFSNLVPSTSTSSCNAINTTGMRPLRKSSMAKSGNAINSIASSIAEGMQYRGRVKHSYPAFIISDENNSNGNLAETGSVAAPAAAHTRNIYVEVDREQRVNFQLPDNRRPSVCFQMSQPTLRERVRGSPRFPHRIAPTSSLNALEDGQTASGSCLGSTGKLLNIVYVNQDTNYYEANLCTIVLIRCSTIFSRCFSEDTNQTQYLICMMVSYQCSWTNKWKHCTLKWKFQENDSNMSCVLMINSNLPT